MDDGSARAVRVAFDRLYRDGLAYRTEALVNWCPGCRTSVSDLEVVPTEETGTLWSVRYHLVDPATGEPSADETITVATTRPETILGDTAVAVHPDDERYAALIGRTVRIPFVERDVPIIADEVVQRDFGTGAVKITPAHDHEDHATGLRHGLPGPDDPGRRRLGHRDRHAVRRAGPLRGACAGSWRTWRPAATSPESATHPMIVGRCQRSEDVLEPRLKTQWFIRMETLAARALDATRSGRTRILPERFEKTWEHWLTNIRDWNVSRQLWWGHRIPAWYCPDGHVTVSADARGPGRPARRAVGPSSDLQQDPDIFDTWFSSGLWPFSTLGWPDATPDLQRFYPTSVMETGYDIIFFWVARMMMLGLHLTDQEPFHTIYLSGLIRDPEGKKMSKTKGNVVDPLGVIDETGADALRFAVIHGTTAGQDQTLRRGQAGERPQLRQQAVERDPLRGRRAAGLDPRRRRATPARRAPPGTWLSAGCVPGPPRPSPPSTPRWPATSSARSPGSLYDAIWSEYCDWGLELAKVRLATSTLDPEVHEATWWTLVEVLDTYLRLLHPVMPFVTEALWAAIPHRASDPELLIVARWPGAGPRDEAIETEVEAVLGLIRGVRNARSEARLEPGRLAADRGRPAGGARPDVRDPATGRRATGPRPPDRATADPRSARR